MEIGIGKYGGLQPSFARVTEASEDEQGFYASMMSGIGNCIGFLGTIPCCVCFPNPYKRVQQGSVGVVTRFGRFQRLVDPGLVKVNPVTESISKSSIKISISDIGRQEIMTKDNVSIAIESVLFWHIVDPYEAHFGVTDVEFALIERARTSLRDVCGSHFLQDLIENRDVVSAEIKKIIDPIAQKWGVKIEATLVKDITFSKQLMESLASAAMATRLGEAKVITSKAEVEVAELLKQSSEILSTKAAFQLRYLETLISMSKAGQGPKTLFMTLPSSGGPASLGHSSENAPTASITELPSTSGPSTSR
ncbi:hypothetical protein BCR42DRAFT_199021 [Absidia repens]|uniref:Band 7 domain-containing protein n=1 Tax=Absidia repens TaxID=90262 RepID=A0A1X2HX77_9FUNG|nr:hypothetical protein BCR42DRAFT_199021 [Absidia repens]